jgi:hypothetical protein
MISTRVKPHRKGLIENRFQATLVTLIKELSCKNRFM